MDDMMEEMMMMADMMSLDPSMAAEMEEFEKLEK